MQQICLALVVLALVALRGIASDYYAIEVVDADTDRGVPMVELRTVNDIVYYTDSAGWVAFREPGLMDRQVFFAVKSHGYEYAADGFGICGARLKPVAGEKATLKIKRLNIAERLYRVTGEGIYRDSVLLGRKSPIEQPLLNGGVLGQDSVRAAIYRNKLFWIWGDTTRAKYPLGNFRTTAATSLLPGTAANRGGLDPSLGVNLHYFVDTRGVNRAMAPVESIEGPGMVWLGGLVVLADNEGRDRLIASYARLKSLNKPQERGLVVFDDQAEIFRRLCQFDVDAPMYLEGHPIRVEERGTPYFYCNYSVPYTMRVRADWDAIQDPAEFEGFTCLLPQTRFAGAQSQIERDAAGKPVWAWKKNTPPLSADDQAALLKARLLADDETRLLFRDIDSGKPVKAHAGSIRWNEFRKNWIAIFSEYGGHSMLGEIWFAEAPQLTGPWSGAKKIITHDAYSFYNPVQHPFFDQDGGRLIYLEGTYSATFSGNSNHTPRYDYNQIMYRLDLGDPRLKLMTGER
ncbi:MAG: hypothetical protein IT427_06655 [Pirellulales bacterium]|nr:hypothetical protein [Pirellulales bacterium]